VGIWGVGPVCLCRRCCFYGRSRWYHARLTCLTHTVLSCSRRSGASRKTRSERYLWSLFAPCPTSLGNSRQVEFIFLATAHSSAAVRVHGRGGALLTSCFAPLCLCPCRFGRDGIVLFGTTAICCR
ncbi:unnamed protein product, partial [Ectocarpus fasciculatus]